MYRSHEFAADLPHVDMALTRVPDAAPYGAECLDQKGDMGLQKAKRDLGCGNFFLEPAKGSLLVILKAF